MHYNNSCILYKLIRFVLFYRCKVVTITDSYTINLSKRIMDGVKQHLGHSPMRLVNWVKRIMLDPNRDLDEGTFQNPYAVELFNLYRNNITYLIEKAGGNGCLVLDLHGMGSSNPNMTQLGEYSKICLKQSFKRRPKIGFQYLLSLTEGR